MRAMLQNLIGRAILQSDSSIGIDENNHEGGHQDVDNEQAVNDYVDEAPYHAIVLHPVEVQETYTLSSDD